MRPPAASTFSVTKVLAFYPDGITPTGNPERQPEGAGLFPRLPVRKLQRREKQRAGI